MQLHQLQTDPNGIPTSIPGQDKRLERWHVALAGQIAAELRHSSVELKLVNQNGDGALSEVNRERAESWRRLSERMSERIAGVAGIEFLAGDIELVRWYALVQMRQLMRRDSKAVRTNRRMQVDHLSHALLAMLSNAERLKVAGVPALREMLP